MYTDDPFRVVTEWARLHGHLSIESFARHEGTTVKKFMENIDVIVRRS